MKLSEFKFDIIKYASPYECDGMYYHPTSVDCVKKSMYDFIWPYVVAQRCSHTFCDNDVYEAYAQQLKLSAADIERLNKESEQLNENAYFMMFVYVDHGYMIPDDILDSNEKLYEFFKEQHNIIIGPKMNHLGEYIHRSGTWRDGLDIFFNFITELEQQYHNNNKFDIDEEKYFKRTFFIRDSEDCYDTVHLTILPKKVKHFISNHGEDEEDEIHGLDLQFDEDGKPEDVIFVRDMFDNTTI